MTNESFSDWRKTRDGMTQGEAVAYLSEIIETSMPWLSLEPHPVDAWPETANMTPAEYRLAKALVSRSGSIVQYYALDSVASGAWVGADVPSRRQTLRHLQTMREKLPPERGRVELMHGIGARFIPAGTSADGALAEFILVERPETGMTEIHWSKRVDPKMPPLLICSVRATLAEVPETRAALIALAKAAVMATLDAKAGLTVTFPMSA